MRSTSGMRPISGSTLPALAFSLRSTVNCLSARFLLAAFLLGLLLGAFGRARFGRGFALADAVADVGHRIEAAHVLLLEEIDGVALALGEQGDKHVGAGDLVAAGRLDVQDRALDDALEAAGRGRIGCAVGDQSAPSSWSRYCFTEARSSSRLTPQAVITFDAWSSSTSAMSRCSRVAYSCRRLLASPRALWRVCSSSRAKLGI